MEWIIEIVVYFCLVFFGFRFIFFEFRIVCMNLNNMINRGFFRFECRVNDFCFVIRFNVISCYVLFFFSVD